MHKILTFGFGLLAVLVVAAKDDGRPKLGPYSTNKFVVNERFTDSLDQKYLKAKKGNLTVYNAYGIKRILKATDIIWVHRVFKGTYNKTPGDWVLFYFINNSSTGMDYYVPLEKLKFATQAEIDAILGSSDATSIPESPKKVELHHILIGVIILALIILCLKGFANLLNSHSSTTFDSGSKSSSSSGFSDNAPTESKDYYGPNIFGWGLPNQIGPIKRKPNGEYEQNGYNLGRKPGNQDNPPYKWKPSK